MKSLVRLMLVGVLAGSLAAAHAETQLRFCIYSVPKSLNPLVAADDSEETLRYLTGGVLLRVNRLTQQPEPALAQEWKVSADGKTISFRLRDGVRFSDGTPFSADDVVYTVEQLMDPAVHSPTGDSFRSGEGKVVTRVLAKDRVSVTFPAPVAGLDKLFDQVAIMSSHSPAKEMAALGPYFLADSKAGSYFVLKRNPNYWKRDSQGKQLPYIDSIRLDIQQNRELEMLRFRRAEIDFINSVNAEYFDTVVSENPAMAHDAGVSLDSDFMWFNQVADAPISNYKKTWFTRAGFRRAISAAINRDDMVRIVFHGRAKPAIGPFSPANKFWFNATLQPHAFDRNYALQLLKEEGFELHNGNLYDKVGHTVEFSIVTNSGNKYRERMATMIQQDLSALGIKVNIVALDFPSLIDRISHTFDYEACLLGLVNNDLDPYTQMNVWLSSAENHQWNPAQKSPATAWEAKIDRLMRLQASSLNQIKRKEYFDQVQKIVWEQEPFIYLVNRNALSLVSPSLRNVRPSVLRPQVYWNIDEISLDKAATSH